MGKALEGRSEVGEYQEGRGIRGVGKRGALGRLARLKKELPGESSRNESGQGRCLPTEA